MGPLSAKKAKAIKKLSFLRYYEPGQTAAEKKWHMNEIARCRRYFDRGYGATFLAWAKHRPEHVKRVLGIPDFIQSVGVLAEG